jgi:hypothetical protein
LRQKVARKPRQRTGDFGLAANRSFTMSQRKGQASVKEITVMNALEPGTSGCLRPEIGCLQALCALGIEISRKDVAAAAIRH